MSTLNSRLQRSILNRKKSKSLAEKGFTLIELLITVVILGTLSAVAVPGFLAQKNKADVAAANAQGRALMAACKAGLSDSPVTAVDINLRSAEDFGGITWTPTLAPDGIPTTCTSTTTGATTAQEYKLNPATGEVTDFATTPGKAQNAI